MVFVLSTLARRRSLLRSRSLRTFSHEFRTEARSLHSVDKSGALSACKWQCFLKPKRLATQMHTIRNRKRSTQPISYSMGPFGNEIRWWVEGSPPRTAMLIWARIDTWTRSTHSCFANTTEKCQEFRRGGYRGTHVFNSKCFAAKKGQVVTLQNIGGKLRWWEVKEEEDFRIEHNGW